MTTLIAIAFIDRLGRKPLLIAGSIGMAAALLTMAMCFAFATKGPDGSPVLTGNMGIVALLAANIYVFFSGLPGGRLSGVLLGEMFPNRIRAAGLSLAAWYRLGVEFCSEHDISSNAGRIGLGASYMIYGGMAIISLFFVLKFVKETKGKELESM